MLYALPNKSLLKVKQAMKKHIYVEKTSVPRHCPPYFSEENLSESFSKQDCSPRRNIKP